MDSKAQEPEWVAKAMEELQNAEKEYEQEKLKEDLVLAITKMSYDERMKLKEVMDGSA